MTGQSIRDQLWRAADPDGSQRALLDAAALAGRAPAWLQRLGRSVDASWTRVADLGKEQTALLDSIEAAVRLLVPRGWAVMHMDTEAVNAAVAAMRAGNPDEADDLLAMQWEDEGDWRIRRVGQRVRSMAAADEELNALFRERARLLDLAAEHHRAGRYDASVPILLAHIEGVVIDVTDGKKYFTKRSNQKADVVDPNDLAGIEACMAALQVAYGEDVPDTQAAGSLSRQGVLHGRELAYDTRVNSAKTWSVMDAVVHWALPQSRALADARRAARQAANAGSGDTDARGRRVDHREIAETRDVLRLLGTSAMGWHRQRGCFRADLVGTQYDAKDFIKRGLSRPIPVLRPWSARMGRPSRTGAQPFRAGCWASRSAGTASTSASTCTRPRTRPPGCPASRHRLGARCSTRHLIGAAEPSAQPRQPNKEPGVVVPTVSSRRALRESEAI
jgi:hypothetical protein